MEGNGLLHEVLSRSRLAVGGLLGPVGDPVRVVLLHGVQVEAEILCQLGVDVEVDAAASSLDLLGHRRRQPLGLLGDIKPNRIQELGLLVESCKPVQGGPPIKRPFLLLLGKFGSNSLPKAV